MRSYYPRHPTLIAASDSALADDITVIQIDYEPGTPDAARVFRAMAGLIDAFYQIDRDLAHAVTADVEPVVRRERV